MSEEIHVVTGSEQHKSPYRAEDAAVHDSFSPASLQGNSEWQTQRAEQ